MAFGIGLLHTYSENHLNQNICSFGIGHYAPTDITP